MEINTITIMKTKILILLFPILLFAQNPAIQWQKTIGGDDFDHLVEVIDTKDGGYVTLGYSLSGIAGEKTQENWSGFIDFWIVKIDEQGTVMWDKRYGGAEQDIPVSIKETNGGYYIVGYSDSLAYGDKTEDSQLDPIFTLNMAPAYDFWILKIDLLGNVIWDKTTGVANPDTPSSFLITQDGGLLLAGSSSHANPLDDGPEGKISISRNPNEINDEIFTKEDYEVVKLSNLGVVEWSQEIKGTESDQLLEIVTTNDGGYLLVGNSSSPLGLDKTVNGFEIYNEIYQVWEINDIWLIKINNQGIIEWQKVIGGNQFEKLISVKKNNDQTFTLLSKSLSPISGNKTTPLLNATNGDLWSVTIDENGAIINQSSFPLWSNIYMPDKNIILLDSGNYIYFGANAPTIVGTNYDCQVKIISPSGIVLSELNFGGDNGETIKSMVPTPDGGYIVGAISNSNISGDKTEDSRGVDDYWLVKLTPESLATSTNSKFFFSIFPNPSNGKISITGIKGKHQVKITDVLGHVVYNETVTEIANKQIDISGESGIYFISIQDELGNNSTKKVVLEK